MTGEADRERLDVIAALLSYDAPLSDAADAWIAPDGAMLSDAEVGLIDSATDREWALAEGLSGTSDPVSDPDAETIAALLRLAAGEDVAVVLTLGLREAFASAGEPVKLSQAERSAVLADRFRGLALPGLDDDAKARAELLLARLSS